MTSRHTIRDVASAAGVSTATVSRVLNRSAPVAAETRERVEQVVAELHFVTSPGARSLRPNVRSMTWGLLVDDVDSHWFGRLVGRLDEAAQAHASTLIVSITQKDPEREHRLVAEMAARRVDGLLVVPTTDAPDTARRTWAPPMPVVHVDRIPRRVVGDVVTFDYYAAVTEQIEQLWQRGHRRIAFIGGVVSEDPGIRRYAAYRDTLHGHGHVPAEELISTGHLTGETAARALTEMLARPDPPTGVVTTVGTVLLGLLRGIGRGGADLEIVGSEDFGAGFLSPVPLTLVQADAAELARRSADVLTARIAGTAGAPTTTLLPTTLVQHGPHPHGPRTPPPAGGTR